MADPFIALATRPEKATHPGKSRPQSTPFLLAHLAPQPPNSPTSNLNPTHHQLLSTSLISFSTPQARRKNQNNPTKNGPTPPLLLQQPRPRRLLHQLLGVRTRRPPRLPILLAMRQFSPLLTLPLPRLLVFLALAVSSADSPFPVTSMHAPPGRGAVGAAGGSHVWRGGCAGG